MIARTFLSAFEPIISPLAPRWGVILWIACFGFLATAAESAELSPVAAINKAGRQRMLSQRIIKAYCQVGLGVEPRQSRIQIQNAVELFDSQLRQLQSGISDSKARQALSRLARQWRPVRSIATGPVNRAGAKKLMKHGDALLASAHQVTDLLDGAHGKQVGQLVNLAGRQRMLSQRLAKAYMLKLWGFDNPAMREEIEAAGREFADALTILRAAPENTPALNQELDAVALQWEWFRHALMLEGAYSYRLIVAEASESILQSMELITRMYEDLPAQ